MESRYDAEAVARSKFTSDIWQHVHTRAILRRTAAAKLFHFPQLRRRRSATWAAVTSFSYWPYRFSHACRSSYRRSIASLHQRATFLTKMMSDDLFLSDVFYGYMELISLMARCFHASLSSFCHHRLIPGCFMLAAFWRSIVQPSGWCVAAFRLLFISW